MTTRSRTMSEFDRGSKTQVRPVASAQGGASHPVATLQQRVGDGGWECRVIMDSNPHSIPLLVAWLLDISARTMGESLRLRVCGALQELLLNAVEHGNLELSYQEKHEALIAGSYDLLLVRRMAEPRLKDRRVTVQVFYDWDGTRVTYRIADEGQGFLWSPFLHRYPAVGRLEESNGRGISLVRSLFPSLTYNEWGNEVTLTVPLPEQTDIRPLF